MAERTPELRIGDRERDLVASVLQDALAEGRITMEELEERVDAALRAKTYADLDLLVADLPIEPPSSALTRPRGGIESRLADAPGASANDRLVLDAGWSSVARSGRWDVPGFLLLNGAVGSIKLDCLQATALADVIDIQVIGSAGSVTIVVPESWGSTSDRLTSSWGSASLKVSPKPAPGAPLLMLHGSVGWGSLTVRHANWFDRRKIEKQALAADEHPQLGC